MEKRDQLILSQDDFQKISLLVRTASGELAELLEEELNRAQVVEDTKLLLDRVMMNSKVQFLDLESGKNQEITLVYPHEANIEENKVSILAPVGAALLGLKVGGVIEWPLPGGKKKKIQVLAVEANFSVN